MELHWRVVLPALMVVGLRVQFGTALNATDPPEYAESVHVAESVLRNGILRFLTLLFFFFQVKRLQPQIILTASRATAEAN